MKNILISILIVTGFIVFSCDNGEHTTNFSNLTSNVWDADSLLANGEDAGGPGQILEKFNGIILFNEDGSGTFGEYEGTWYFANDETNIVISSDSLIMPLTTLIEELTNSSLKMTTVFPNFVDPDNPTNIRMTFKAQ